MKIINKSKLLLALALALSSCSGLNKNGEPLPKTTFSHAKKVPVYVASYEVLMNDSARSITIPEGVVMNPGAIVNDYLNSRYEASGGAGKMIIRITDASVKYNRVASDNTLGAIVGVDHKDNYRAEVTVEVGAYGLGNNNSSLRRSLTVYRDISMSEHVSLVEREKIQMQAMDSMINDLDTALCKVLKETFSIVR